MTPQLTVDATMEILRTTVPRLEELTHGLSQKWLSKVTDYGWSMNDQLAHLRACHDILGGNMLRKAPREPSDSDQDGSAAAI